MKDEEERTGAARSDTNTSSDLFISRFETEKDTEKTHILRGSTGKTCLSANKQRVEFISYAPKF